MDQQRPIVVVTGSRQEHELFTMGYACLFGLAALVSDGRGNIVFSAVSHALFVAWSLAMVVSSLLVLVGCFWRHNVATGLFMEQLGLYVNSACLFTFAFLAYQAAGGRAAFTIGICLAWILANIVRAWRVGKDQRQLRRAHRVSAAE